MNKVILTLCMVVKKRKLLLGMKKRGFGMGKWNGFGGKVEAGESVTDAAKRECLEESGITAEDMTEMGVLEFEFPEESTIRQVHVFQVKKFEGVPNESEEMKPLWFDFADIPYDQMWPDDCIWLPALLEEKKFHGKVTFSPEHQIISSNITINE